MKNVVKKPIKTKKQRLVIYKKVLKEVENKESDGLCIRLKEVAGIDFYDTYIPETDVLFPEFGNFINIYRPIKYLNLLGPHGDINDNWRIKVLNECIKLCRK